MGEGDNDSPQITIEIPTNRFTRRNNMLARALLLFGSVTLAITVSIGPYLVSISHTVGGETRVAHGIAVGRLQKWKSWCFWGCSPNSKVEHTETVDMSAGLIALNANRSGKEFTADVGLQRSVSGFDDDVEATFSANVTLHDKDAKDFLHSRIVRPFVPQAAEKLMTDDKIVYPPLRKKPAFVSEEAWKGLVYPQTYRPASRPLNPVNQPAQVMSAKMTPLASEGLSPELQRAIDDFNRQFSKSPLYRSKAAPNSVHTP
jgi:hypothetical protein